MTILAVDPGSARLGWAVVTPGTGRVLALGTFVSSPDPSVAKSTDRARRAYEQARALRALAVRHRVTTIIAEAVSIAGGPARFAMATSLDTSWGVLVSLAACLGAELLEVTPKQWQHAVEPDAEGAVDYARLEARLAAFVGPELLAGIKRADRNHALDAVAIGLYAALRNDATRIAARVKADADRLSVLRDALIGLPRGVCAAVIAFAITTADDYDRRCREQIAELRHDNGLCKRCGEQPHAGRCRFRWSYLERKQIGRCTYNGCDQPCSETSVQCEAHAAATVERQRKHRASDGDPRVVTPIATLAAATPALTP